MLPVRVNDLLSNRYRLEGKLGEGGMGVVYTGNDSELDRKVAVKLLAANLVNDPEVVERFEREARLTAKLDHPNIVPIYDVGRHEGRPFIVMKLLQGDTLAGLLRTKGGLTSEETLRLMTQVGAGLDYIHQKGFIHRDIKSGNIHVAADGLATILDFGILRSRDTSKGLTRTGMVMGTPHYMAPEQALGLKDVDHRVDLYALGVVLFECLTGTLPFEADSELRLIQMQAHAPPPDILDRAPWITRPVADVVRRALAKRPEDRFFSGAELVKALEGAYRASRGHPAAPVRPDGAAAPSPVMADTSPGWRKAAAVGSATGTQASDSQLANTVKPNRAPFVAAGVALVVALIALGVFRPWAGVVSLGLLDAGEPVVMTEPYDAGPLDVAVKADLDAGPELVMATLAPDGGDDEDEDAGLFAVMDFSDAGRRVGNWGSKRKGHLSVLSARLGEPYWATVFIDGVAKGRTPLGLDLAAGRYVVRVERAGFRTQEKEVRVASGKSTSIRVDLVP